MDTTIDRDLLLDVGVPFKIDNGVVMVEAQAHNGLLKWLDHFPRITLCAPVIPTGLEEPSVRWLSAAGLMADGRLNVSPFPWGYDSISHLKYVAGVRKALRRLIPHHHYLCFSNLGWLGCWGRIAAEEAYKLDRPYSVWLDWVLHAMPARVDSSPSKRMWHRIQRSMLTRTSIRDIRRCSLGLFHGKTVFDGYSMHCKNPRIVHDIHLGQSDIISVDQLEARLQRERSFLQIIYVGRVHEMKGPRHWLDVVQNVILKAAGRLEIRAEWLGDGPLLDEMRDAVAARGLARSVSFPGAELDRRRLLDRLRQADLFVFCHLTPESPRCLIEALMSGLPMYGFESAYASDLLDGREGGKLTRLGDQAELSAAILDVVLRPTALKSMARTARLIGSNFSDVAVFRHRSELIKKFLAPVSRTESD